LEKLKHLFQPLKIGSMEVQNRIVMSGILDLASTMTAASPTS